MWIFVAIPVAIFVLFTNLIVLTLIYRSRKLQTLRNVPLVGLATADMLVGALWIPLATASTYDVDNKILCRVALYFEILTMHASLFNLIAVSSERWIAIFRPLHYYQIATKSKVIASLTASWVLSFIVLFVFLIADRYDQGVTECDIVKYANIWFLFLISVIFYIVCGIMIIMQLKVYMVVRNQLRKIRPTRVQPNVHSGLIAATSFIVEDSANVIVTADDMGAKKVDRRKSIMSLNTVSRLGCVEPIKECPDAFNNPKGFTELTGTLRSQTRVDKWPNELSSQTDVIEFTGTLRSQTGANKCLNALSNPNRVISDTSHFPLNSGRHRRLQPIIKDINDNPKVASTKRSSINKNVLSREHTESKIDLRIARQARRTSAGLDNGFSSKTNLDQCESNQSNVSFECSVTNKVADPVEDVGIAKNNFMNTGIRMISQKGAKNRAMLYSKCEKPTEVDTKSSITSIEFCNIVNVQHEDTVKDETKREKKLKTANLWRIKVKGHQYGIEKQWINNDEISRANSMERNQDNNSDNGYQSISDERPSLTDIFTASGPKRDLSYHPNFTASSLVTESSGGPNFTTSSSRQSTGIQPVDKAAAKRAARYSVDDRAKRPPPRPKKKSFLAIARVFTTVKKQRRKEFARSLATNLVCLCFVVMWAPKSTVDLLTGLGYCQGCSMAHSVSAVFAWTNSGINALIYAWRMPEFREAILACKISRFFKFKNQGT